MGAGHGNPVAFEFLQKRLYFLLGKQRSRLYGMLAGILYKCAALQVFCAEPVFCLKPADRFVEEVALQDSCRCRL